MVTNKTSECFDQTKPMDKSLYSIAAEQSVLGGLMLDSSAWSQIANELSTENFYLPKHRIIFAAIERLNKSSISVDPLTVADELKKINQLDICGSEVYLYEIEKNTPSIINVRTYAKIVREKAQKRKFIETIEKYKEDILSGKDLCSITDAAVKEFKDINLTTTRKLEISTACLSYQDLITTNISRELLIAWLPEGGLSMVYAERGLGKTFFALSLSYAIACGNQFMRWKILKNVPCLYLDGEMSLAEMRERVTKIFASSILNWFILSHENFFNKFEEDLYITNFKIQDAILKMIDEHGIKFIVLDNLSSLCRIREDKSDDWREIMQPFLIACRRRGVAVLIVHHASKSGDQRGTGAREDALDTSIKLSKLNDTQENDGAKFLLEFTKHRSCFGKDADKIVAKLIDKNGILNWEVTSVEQNTKNQMLQLINDHGEDGISAIEIAAELDISQAMVSKYRRQLIAEKLITNTAGKQPLKSIEYAQSTYNQNDT